MNPFLHHLEPHPIPARILPVPGGKGTGSEYQKPLMSLYTPTCQSTVESSIQVSFCKIWTNHSNFKKKYFSKILNQKTNHNFGFMLHCFILNKLNVPDRYFFSITVKF